MSVHGANRLGSNSLCDLVVFGKAAGARAAEGLSAGESHRDLPKDAGDESLARLDKFRNAKGKTPTAELRLAMQLAMQAEIPVGSIYQFFPDKSAVVDAVGARSSAQASRATDTSTWTSAWRASVESGRPVSATIGAPTRRISS